MKTIKLFVITFVLLLSIPLKAQSSEDVKKTIMEAYDIFNSRNVTKERMSPYVDDNYLDHTPDPGQPAGIDGLVQSFENFKKAFPDYKIKVNDLSYSSEDEKATVLITISGTNTGEFMGMAPTGRAIEFEGVDYLVFKNKKCTERWGYFQQIRLMQELGLMKQ